MISLSEAMSIAKELKENINYCMEYSDAFVFSNKYSEEIGGDSPIVILKENGDAINMVDYTDLPGVSDFIKEFSI